MKELINRIPCSVSQELVEMVADRYPSEFRDDKGSINLPKLLFTIGFKVEYDGVGNRSNLGYYTIPDVHVRDNYLPSRLYKTSFVYNGEVRNEVISSENGRYEYSNVKHSLCSLYESLEVLQPINLDDYVLEDDFINILDFGDPTVYDKSFLNKEKPKNLDQQSL